jgi:hypothetical protein
MAGSFEPRRSLATATTDVDIANNKYPYVQREHQADLAQMNVKDTNIEVMDWFTFVMYSVNRG